MADEQSKHTRILPKPRGLKQLILDAARFTERAKVHFAGEYAAVPDLTRTCIPLSNVDELGRVIDSVRVGEPFRSQSTGTVDSEMTVTAVINRFAVPAPSGYRDLKYHLRHANTARSTLRFVFDGLFKTQLLLQAPNADSNALAAIRHLNGESYFAVVEDNFNFNDETSLTLVSGFPSLKTARTYARLRMNDCVARLAEQCHGLEDLLGAWLMYGEDITVACSGDDHGIHSTSDELVAHLVEGPVSPFRDWYGFGAQFELSFAALRHGNHTSTQS